MARYFTGTNTARLASPVAVNQSTATMSFWSYTISANWNFIGMLFMFWNTASNKYWGVYINTGTLHAGWTEAIVTSVASLTLNSWHHFCLRGNGAIQSIWIDGAWFGGISQTPVSDVMTKLAIGSHYDNTSYPALSRIADCAYWDVVLTDNEVIELSKGRRPTMVRPLNIQGYWPCDGIESPEPDLSRNAKNVTLSGTAFAPGPPVTMLTPRWPNNDFTTSAPSFIPAWAAQSNLPVIGAGTY